jgi:hypothetical protein
MLECFDLADQLSHIPPNFGCHHFHRADIEIGINQESSADIHPGIFVIHTVDTSYASARIRQQRKRNAAFDHLRQFFFLPDFMGEAAVCADGKYLNP